jgi:hypothetical protein
MTLLSFPIASLSLSNPNLNILCDAYQLTMDIAIRHRGNGVAAIRVTTRRHRCHRPIVTNMEFQAVKCSCTDSTEKKDFAEAHPIEQSKHMTTIMRRTFMMGGGCLCQGNRLRFCFIVVFRRYSGHKMTVGLVAKKQQPA